MRIVLFHPAPRSGLQPQRRAEPPLNLLCLATGCTRQGSDTRIIDGFASDVPILWGGIHPTLMPEQTLENPFVDTVVSGEGEATFEEPVKAPETGSPLGRAQGVWQREHGAARFTGARPFIDRDWIFRFCSSERGTSSPPARRRTRSCSAFPGSISPWPFTA